jgi:hypothetical protein
MKTITAKLRAALSTLSDLTMTGAVGAAAAIIVREPLAQLIRDMPGTERKQVLGEIAIAINKLTHRLHGKHPDCQDCGAYGYGYMLHDHVWKEAVAKQPASFLCMHCVNKRLGWLLTRADFDETQRINQPIFAAMAVVIGGSAWDEARTSSMVHTIFSQPGKAWVS